MAHYAVFSAEHPDDRAIFQRPEQALVYVNSLIELGLLAQCEAYYRGEYKPVDIGDLYAMVMGWDI